MALLRPVGLGDLLLAVPAFRALRTGFPDAEITLVSLPAASEFAHRFSHYIDRFVPFYGFPDPRDDSQEPFSYGSVPRRGDDDRYDLAVQLLDGEPRSNAWARALGARMTAGYFLANPPAFLTLAMSYPEHVPETTRLLRLTHIIGCPSADDTLEFPLFLQDHAEACRALNRIPYTPRPTIAIHVPPGVNVGQAASLADMLAWEGHGSVALVGEETRAVRQHTRTRVEDLGRHLSAGGLAAIFSRMALVVVADSDMLALAAAVGTPALLLGSDCDSRTYAQEAQVLLASRAAV